MRNRNVRRTKEAFVLSCLCSVCKLYGEGKPSLDGDFPVAWQVPEKDCGRIQRYLWPFLPLPHPGPKYPNETFLRPRASGICRDAQSQRARDHRWSDKPVVRAEGNGREGKVDFRCAWKMMARGCKGSDEPAGSLEPWRRPHAAERGARERMTPGANAAHLDPRDPEGEA